MLLPFRVPTKHAVPLLAFAVIFALAGCGGSSSSQPFTAGQQFLYIADFDAAKITAFSIDGSSGSLTAVTNSPFTADNKPVSVAAHPTKNFIYVGNNGDNTITTYSYDSTGAITKVAAHPLPAAPSQLLVDSGGSTVYALVPSLGEIVSYAIDPSSSDLTSSSSLLLNGGAAPTRMAFDATAANLYAVDAKGLMSVIGVSGGTFSEASNSPIALTDKPLDIVCCKNGSFYIVDFFANKVIQYTASTANASLTLQRGTALTTANNPNRIVLDKTGAYVIVSSQTTANMTFFALDPGTSAPTTTTLSATTENGPSCIIQDSSGQFFFTTDHDANGVTGIQLSVSKAAVAAVGTSTTAAGPVCGAAASLH